MKSYGVTIQMKPRENDHSLLNETTLTVLPHGAICFSALSYIYLFFFLILTLATFESEIEGYVPSLV